MKISDEEYQKIVMKSEAEYDRLKDTVHDYYDKIQEQEKEIERLMSLWETDRQSWNELMAEEEFKIERLNNIIKEVREKTKENQEYLESAKEMYLEQDDELLKIHTVQLINNNLSQNDDILEILDKENKE